MQMIRASAPHPPPGAVPAPVLRRCACGGKAPGGGECEACKQKRLQRSASSAGPASAPPGVHDVLRGPGTPLDGATRAMLEPRFGHSFAQVRVHADGRAAESAAAVGAHAYTVGRDVVFGAGKYAPASADGRRLIAHELAHVVQQSAASSSTLQPSLAIGAVDAPEEREAERAADAVLRGGRAAVSAGADAAVRRAAIHRGNILDEGSCEHLACNSKWACENAKGVECPDGTRNAFGKTKKKYSPLFTCDATCEKAAGCSDGANWMAIPNSRFKRSKCAEDLVICAKGHFTHANVRDRSEIEAWEVSHGVQDDLTVSPYAKFSGAVYADENDAGFKTDARCGNGAKKQEAKGASLAPDAGQDPGPDAGVAGPAVSPDAGAPAAPRESD
jgi:hypothetical protein